MHIDWFIDIQTEIRKKHKNNIILSFLLTFTLTVQCLSTCWVLF